MRIKLTLIPKEKKCTIPINYQYPLSSAIYKILFSASKDYANFLHKQGYLSEHGKPLKLFTFSYLNIPGVKNINNTLTVWGSPPCTLYVSSPLLEDFIQNFVIGLFQNQEVAIGNKYIVGRFIIQQVESIMPPNFSNKAYFKCLSPFVLSTMKERNGKIMPYYYRANDPELGEAVRKNLMQKYKTIYKKAPEDESLHFELDKKYIDRRGGFNKISKLITIKENSETEKTKIKSILAPFSFCGSPELMKVAWEAGMGNHCSQGFGMIDLVSK